MAQQAMDQETRAVSDDHGAIRLWLRMLATNRLVETRTRRLLQERFATTLPRFDLMAQLERAPRGLKMGELSKRMMVTAATSPASPTCWRPRAWSSASRTRPTAAPGWCA
jgi:hypothetical protein